MSLTLTRLQSIPLVDQGDDLVDYIFQGLRNTGVELQDNDIIAVTQKVVSKSEGCAVSLSTVVPSAMAETTAVQAAKDSRLVELILREAAEVLRVGHRSVIVRHRLGMVCPNAGIDQSNVSAENVDGNSIALLLPLDPDASARRIQRELISRGGHFVGVIIVDSHGRPFRRGSVGVCLGVAGIPALADLRGRHDLFGRVRRGSVVGVADELASAASLLMGQADEGYPFVHIRGFPYPLKDDAANALYRPVEVDLFGRSASAGQS